MKRGTVWQIVKLISQFSLNLEIQFWKYFHSIILGRLGRGYCKKKLVVRIFGQIFWLGCLSAFKEFSINLINIFVNIIPILDYILFQLSSYCNLWSLISLWYLVRWFFIFFLYGSSCIIIYKLCFNFSKCRSNTVK